MTYIHTKMRSTGQLIKVISKKQEIAIFYFYDLDLEPMSLILKLDLDIVVTY